MAKSKVKAGQQYGMLTVVEEVAPKYSGANKKYKIKQWLCQCVCGNTRVVNTQYLTQSSHKEKQKSPPSCGCANNIGGRFTAKYSPQEASFQRLLGRYKSKAKTRGIAWHLSDKDAIALFKQSCHYCGIEPSQEMNVYKYRKDKFADSNARLAAGAIKYNGIDRLNSNKDYSVSNCVASCYICNRAKMDMKPKEFDKWIERLVKRWLK